MCVCALSRASLLSPQDPLAAAAIVAVRVKEARDLAPFASTQQEHERKRHDQRHPHPHCASHNVRALVRGRVAQAIELFGLKDDSKQDWARELPVRGMPHRPGRRPLRVEGEREEAELWVDGGPGERVILLAASAWSA